MDNQNKGELDMFTELFISPRKPRKYMLPPKSEAEYLNDLQQGADLVKKNEAILALIPLFRLKTSKTRQKYTKEITGVIIEVFKRFASNPALSERAAEELFAEASDCEQVGDYQGALWFYQASLEFHSKDPLLSFFKLNNLGFCLIYMKEFKKAESYLRSATELDPERYNSWKNLGVCLEHQGKPAEAADCYLKAIIQSHGEKRSIQHLLRLVARHPELKATTKIQRFMLNFPTSSA